MFRMFLRYISQGLLVLGPLLTLEWSFLDWCCPNQNLSPGQGLHVWFTTIPGSKQEIEFVLRLIATTIALFLVFTYEILDLYVPRRDLREFRNIFLKEKGKTWRKEFLDDIRINVMFARRYWYFPFFRILDCIWNDGYTPSPKLPKSSRGVNPWLTEWQGLSGLVLRTGEAKWVDFREKQPKTYRFYERWPPWNQFHLWPWQLNKMEHITAALTVPVVLQRSQGVWKSVGVINLESMTDKGADNLLDNKDSLVEYFWRYGKILAPLRW